MITIGIGEYAISNDPLEVIKTHALGSCVAVILHCTKTRHTSMAHIVLPAEHYLATQRFDKPAYYAEDILPRLIESYRNHIKCDTKSIRISMIGGADSMTVDDVFQVGMRNVEHITAILEKYHLKCCYTDIGGNVSRTVEVAVRDGKLNITRQNMVL